MIPLYKTANPPRTCPETANFGLWYDKFCNQWDAAAKDWSFQKEPWIRAAASFAFKNRELVHQFALRRLQMIHALGGRFWVFQTTTPFVTGLGRAHPMENGIAWDYLLGIPVIPGSSIKGALKASNRQYLENAFDLPERIQILDALAYPPISLMGDIMTPHYGPYYQDPHGEEAPGDWFDPTPIPFLTVEPKQNFLFAVICSRQDGDQLEAWLEQTLEWTGLGAKTAVAYGRFSRNRTLENQLRQTLDTSIEQTRKQQQVRKLSPIEQEMWDDGWADNPERFMQALTQKWLERMDSPDEPDENRQRIAQNLKDWYIRYRPEDWKRPNKKNRVKIARIRNVLGDK